MINSINLNSLISSQILGDGYFRPISQTTHRLDISHSIDQLDYLKWKIELFQPFISNRIHLNGPYTNDKTFTSGNPTYKCGFIIPNTMVPVYSNPVDLVYLLDEIGLLLWWLDDGCTVVHHKHNGTSVSRFGYLNTQIFDEKINEQIKSALLVKFGFDLKIHINKSAYSIHPNKTYFRLYFNATNLRLLIDTIRPYIEHIPLCVRYKLNMGYFPTRNLDTIMYHELYNF